MSASYFSTQVKQTPNSPTAAAILVLPVELPSIMPSQKENTGKDNTHGCILSYCMMNHDAVVWIVRWFLSCRRNRKCFRMIRCLASSIRTYDDWLLWIIEERCCQHAAAAAAATLDKVHHMQNQLIRIAMHSHLLRQWAPLSALIVDDWACYLQNGVPPIFIVYSTCPMPWQCQGFPTVVVCWMLLESARIGLIRWYRAYMNALPYEPRK